MSRTLANPHLLHGVVDRIELLDERTCRVADHVATAPGSEPAEASLTRAIYSRLYLGLHTDTADPDDRRLAGSREDPAFARTLTTADGGRHRWEPGWRVVRTGPGHIEACAERDGVHLVATPEQVRPHPLAVGDAVEIAFPTERRYLSPGFYLTDGLAGPVPPSALRMRWYVNVPPDHAATVLAALVQLLDADGKPYAVKTLNDPHAPPRPDALVLYTARDSGVAGHLRAAVADVRLRDAVPAFTRRLAAGVAIADDTADRRLSFGQHRSLLVARGVLAAGPGADVATRRDAVGAAFTRAGLDPTRPYLAPGADELDVPGWSA